MSRSSSLELAVASAPGHPSSPGYDVGQNFTSALAIGLAAMLCTFALLAFYFCRYISLGRRQQQLEQNQQERAAHEQLSSSMSLDDLPAFGSLEELRNREGELKKVIIRGGESCAVCLAELAQETTCSNSPPSSLRIRLLPRCGHCFHCDCVDGWLRLHLLCPICRTSLRSPASSPSGKSSSTSSCLLNSLVVAAAPGSSSVARVAEQPELSLRPVQLELVVVEGQVLIAQMQQQQQHEGGDHSK